ncbi:neuronal acetylcholine receptor subunit alpha-2-like [Toxorhynchites rutilus septentrionalis]|uniref:neuronal acetylcholine receptor subunit alpha-2-like n=1 Tax=Toxorhynchites rutilus septentrionalis TaxID=329112 RepID=UPI00247A0ED6|nr:neuronal acetylcholine receptor subunit alpha-2-like [Toxorhynchites rutilus septentrionalis]
MPYPDYSKYVTSCILIVLCYSQLSECIDCDQEPKHDEGRLKKQLLCGSYDTGSRPVKDPKTTVDVSVTLSLMGHDYDEDYETLRANVMLLMQWKDEHLIWNPQDFKNITKLIVNTDEIWKPDLQLFSSYYKPDTKASCTNPRCHVRNNGTVDCIPSCDFSARCNSDYSNWPLDSQKCRLYYGAWMESAAEVDFHSEASLLLSTQANAHSQWRMVSAKFSKQSQMGKTTNATYPVLIYDYIMERHSSFHLAALLTPILLIVFLNLFLTWLDTDSIERKLLLTVSVFSHFQYMMQMHWAVPYNGETVPGILIFFRNSLIITTLLVIHSMIGTSLKRIECNPPAFVTLIAGTIATNKFGELIFAGDYMNVEYKKTELARSANVDHEENRKTWKSFSKIVDRTLFLVFFCSYATSFFVYVPLQYVRQEEFELTLFEFVLDSAIVTYV